MQPITQIMQTAVAKQTTIWTHQYLASGGDSKYNGVSGVTAANWKRKPVMHCFGNISKQVKRKKMSRIIILHYLVAAMKIFGHGPAVQCNKTHRRYRTSFKIVRQMYLIIDIYNLMYLVYDQYGKIHAMVQSLTKVYKNKFHVKDPRECDTSQFTSGLHKQHHGTI